MGSKQLLEQARKLRGEYQEAWYFSGNLKILDSLIELLSQLVAEDEDSVLPEKIRIPMSIPHCYDGISRAYEPACEVVKKLGLCCCVGYDFSESCFVFTNIKELADFPRGKQNS